MCDRMTEEAKKEGLNFNLNNIKKTSNTVLSHLLIKLAQKTNVHNEVKEKYIELTLLRLMILEIKKF